MLRRVHRPSHATVVAYLALFVALGGVGAYAADKIGSKDLAKNAVKSKHVAADALSSGDLGAGSVGAAEVADGSVGAAEVAAGAIGGAALADGSVGGAEVTDGSLTLADVVPQVIASPALDAPALALDQCYQDDFAVPGLGAGDAFTVILDTGSGLVLEGYGRVPNGQVWVRLCQRMVGGSSDASPISLLVLNYR